MKKISLHRNTSGLDVENTALAKAILCRKSSLKNQDGKDIIAYGGTTFVSALIKEALIDEPHLFINSTAIGKGNVLWRT